MSNTPNTTQTSEEIDLGYLFRKTGDLFRKCVKLLFEIIAFLIKFKFIVIAILLIGFGYGYYKDKTATKIYVNEVVVIPNFESVDYLYSKIEALNAKKTLQDTVFLKSVFGNQYRHLKQVNAEPIIDLYNFLTQTEENLDIFRVIVHNQDFDNYLEDESNYKYNKYHRIKVKVMGKSHSEQIVKNLLDYLNTNPHYERYKEVSRENTALQLAENQQMLAQVDSLIAAASKGTSGGNTSVSVFTQDKNQRNDLILTKQDLLNNQLRLQKRNQDEQEVIMPVSALYNIIGEEGLYIPNKIKTPLLWLFVFCFLFFIRHLYIKMKEIAQQN